MQALRWTARILGLVLFGIVALFFIGEGGFDPSRMTLVEGALMACFLVACLGLLVGWLWEAVGGALTIGGVVLFYLVELATKGRFPSGWAFLLIALPGLLFLICARQHRGAGQPSAA